MLSTYKCAECGNDFTRQYRAMHPPKFCSSVCSGRYNSKRVEPLNGVIPNRKCKGCGGEFKPVHFAHHYCSAKCRVLDLPKKDLKYDCAICGKTFSDNRYRRRTCSDHCKVVLQTWEFDSRPPAKAKPTQVCETCGKTFVSLKKKSRFCSKNCRYSSPKFKENAKEPQVVLDVYPGFGGLDFDGLCPFDPQIYPFKNVEMRGAYA